MFPRQLLATLFPGRARGVICAAMLSAHPFTAAAVPESDHVETMASGATFEVPQAWSIKTTAKVVDLAAPEADLHMAFIDVGAAPDAASAVASAWKIWMPQNARAPKLISGQPAHDGWDNQQIASYEISPNERLAMQATAFLAGATWTVVLEQGSQGTAEKRAAAINVMVQSLRPAGYKPENFAGHAAHPLDAGRIAQLQAFVQQSMSALGVPGAAFALTTREKTIYAIGLGVRELGKPVRVDADTEFGIASNTKSLATLMLAKLVDEGKLRWEEPVTNAYPTFVLGSPATTRKVLIRHLVCACTGLPRKDLQVLFNSNPNEAAQDTFAQLSATEPTSGFGEVYQYNNLMAAAAGYIGGHLAHPELQIDQAFYRSIDEIVLQPLRMTDTTFDIDRARAKDWAAPHADALSGQPQPLLDAGMRLDYAFTRYAGAGGAWSTANDLIKYVRFELNNGRLDNGVQYVSSENLLERRVPNVTIGENKTYGMGLITDKTWGVTVVHHGGSLGGYKSDIIIIPEANVGAVILTNSDNGVYLLRPFMRRLLELLYDGKPEAQSDVTAAGKKVRDELAKDRERVSVTPDQAEVSKLANSYSNPDLGTIMVTRIGKTVQFTFGTFSSLVGSKRNDDGTTSFVLLEPTMLLLPFVASTENGKPALIVRDEQHDFRFVAAG